MIIIPFLNGYFIGNINPTFSDKPIWKTHGFPAAKPSIIGSSPSSGRKRHLLAPLTSAKRWLQDESYIKWLWMLMMLMMLMLRQTQAFRLRHVSVFCFQYCFHINLYRWFHMCPAFSTSDFLLRWGTTCRICITLSHLPPLSTSRNLGKEAELPCVMEYHGNNEAWGLTGIWMGYTLWWFNIANWKMAMTNF